MSKIKKIDKKELRNVAGGFPTGVTVVTVENRKGKVIGMTANSFVCISLDPAIVGFFVMNDGSILKNFRIGSPVSISFLSEDQKAISNQFAGLNETDIPIKYDSRKKYHKIKDALAWYETKIDAITPIGDHYMILCKVINLGRTDNLNPLVYYSGYKKIGLSI